MIYIKKFLKILAILVILLYFYDITYVKFVYGKIYLDVNDGLVILTAFTILLDFTFLKKILRELWSVVIKAREILNKFKK